MKAKHFGKLKQIWSGLNGKQWADTMTEMKIIDFMYKIHYGYINESSIDVMFGQNYTAGTLFSAVFFVRFPEKANGNSDEE